MDKNIIISRDNTDTILIKVNGDEKLKILKDNREINAKDIYDCFSYEIGDIFSVDPLDSTISENDVIKTLENLLKQIAQSLNELTESMGDSNTISNDLESENVDLV